MATYTGSVTLTNINDGADADSYHLSSNIEGFLKHYEYDLAGNEVIIFSDKVIEFLLEHNINGLFLPISPSSYDTSLLTLENEEFDIVSISDISDLWGLFQRINVVNYILLLSKPSNWTTNYNEYYRLISNQYVLITDEEPPEWEDDWLTNPELIPFYLLDSQNTTLYNKVYSIDTLNNSIIFNLYNSAFYPVDETLNLVDGLPSNYLLALKSYRNFVLSHNAYFILNAFEDSNLSELYDYKIFFVEYVVNLDFARFALTATNIQASVDNSALIFDGTGLTIYDGGLTIKLSELYAQTEDSAPELGKTYFVYENKLYIEYTGNFSDGFTLSLSRPDDWDEVYTSYYIYDSVQQKYIAIEPSDPIPTWLANTYYRPVYEIIPASDLLKYDIENKRLNIKGSGEFTGTVYATDGVFSGTIVATTGEIGGFTISNDALISESKSKTLDKTPVGDKKYYELINGEYTIVDLPKLVSLDQVRQPKKDYYIQELLENQEVRYVLYEGYYKITSDLIRQEGKIYYIKIDDEYIEYEGELEQGVNYYEFDTSLQSGVIYYEDYFQSLHTYYDDPSILLIGRDENGLNGKIIAQNIDLGIGANITNYIKLGNAFIYNPLNNNNSFIDIKDANDESIIEFRADGTGNIGAIHINGNTSRLNGINWWISPDKAKFSNIDVTGTIHTSVFETGRILSVGGSMIFKEGARVLSVTNTKEGLLLTLETKMGLKPGSIVLCTTNDSDYTDTTLINLLNFYGRVVSSIIEKEYIENTDPFYENVAYYTYDTQSGKYVRFTGDSFEDGVPYYILYEGNLLVVVELETEAAGYENLISLIIQLGDNTYIETEDLSPQPNKSYYEYNMITDSFTLHTGNFKTGHIYYERTDEYTNNLIIGVNATSHVNKMLYPEGFTFIKFDNLDNENINPTFNNTPILFLGNLDGLNDENITGYGLYGENVFLTGSLTTRYTSTENFKYAGVNTLTGAIATVFREGNYFPGEVLPENDKIIFWAGSNTTATSDVLTSPFLVTENGYFYASHGVFEGSIFVRATIEASELRTASIYGTGDAPALKIYNTSIEKLGIHFYEHNGEPEHETLRLTSAGFSNDLGTSYFINIDGNRVNFNGDSITGNVFYTIPVNNSQLEIIGTNFNVYQYNQEGSANIYRFINFNPDNLFYEIKYDDANRILLDKQNGELTLFSGSTKVSTNLSLGGKIDYKLAIEEREEGNQIISELIGYDLFVR